MSAKAVLSSNSTIRNGTSRASFRPNATASMSLYRTEGHPQANRNKLVLYQAYAAGHAVPRCADERTISRHRPQSLRSGIPAVAFIVLKWLGLDPTTTSFFWFGFSVRSRLLGRRSFALHRQAGSRGRLLRRLHGIRRWRIIPRSLEYRSPSRLLVHRPWGLAAADRDSGGVRPRPVDRSGQTPYYFTGGFTNRDYRPVIETFRELGRSV